MIPGDMLRVRYFNERGEQFGALAENIRYDDALRTDVADLHVLLLDGVTPVTKLDSVPRLMPSGLEESAPERYWFPADVNEEWSYHEGRAEGR